MFAALGVKVTLLDQRPSLLEMDEGLPLVDRTVRDAPAAPSAALGF
jgi:hypothetical protein